MHCEFLGEHNRFTPALNHVTPEMLWVSASSGELFEEQGRVLKGRTDDIVEAVVEAVHSAED